MAFDYRALTVLDSQLIYREDPSPTPPVFKFKGYMRNNRLSLINLHVERWRVLGLRYGREQVLNLRPLQVALEILCSGTLE